MKNFMIAALVGVFVVAGATGCDRCGTGQFWPAGGNSIICGGEDE